MSAQGTRSAKRTNDDIIDLIETYGLRSALKMLKPGQIENELLAVFWGMARDNLERIDDCLAPERWERGYR